jgi:nitroreductase
LKNDDLLAIMRRRRSVRHYSDTPTVYPEELLQLIEAARWAPSANNRQLWKFISVTQKELIQTIAAAIERAVTDRLCRNSQLQTDYGLQNPLGNLLFFKDAPVVLFALVRKAAGFLEAAYDSAELTRQATLLSMGAAIQNLLLAAETLNLDTCWMTGPLLARDRIEAFLGITDPWELVSMIPIGKRVGMAADKSSQRKAIQKIWERIEDAATN